MALRTQSTAKPKPVIGFLNSSSAKGLTKPLAEFRRGLKLGGFDKSGSVAIEYCWAEGRYDRLEKMAADLVRRNVNLIAATGGAQTARAAIKATSTIPILFVSGRDPVHAGIITSHDHPSRNATGVNVETTPMVLHRLEFVNELAPGVKTIAGLVNPNTMGAEIEEKHLQEATRKTGQKLIMLKASAERDFAPAFASLPKQERCALLVHADPFFTSRRDQLIALAKRHRVPTMYPWAAYAEEGGLISYGPNLAHAYRQIGLYAARILKGANPASLPVLKHSKFELVINLKT